MQLVKIYLRITKDVKIQDGCQLWFKKSFLVLGKQQEFQIMKFSLSYSKFSQLSYESGCSHELWCRE